MKKNKKISILKRISLCCLALVTALASFLLPFTSYNSKSLTASANETITNYTFNGSNIYVPLWRLNSVPSGYYYVDTGLVGFSFNISDNNLNIDMSNSVAYVEAQNGSGVDRYNYAFCSLQFGYINSSSYTNSISIPLDSASTWRYSYVYALNSLNSVLADYSLFVYFNSSSFIPDIYRVVLNFETITIASGSSFNANTITYYDINDNYLKFAFENKDSYGGEGCFTYRSYLLSDDLTDNQIFNQGYSQGLADNQQNIYNNGYSAGYAVGESVGFRDGVDSANEYTFTGLFSSVIDVPVKVFSGLFNFELLGVNLLDFFLGLLTFSLVIFIVKLLIGGK